MMRRHFTLLLSLSQSKTNRSKSCCSSFQGLVLDLSTSMNTGLSILCLLVSHNSCCRICIMTWHDFLQDRMFYRIDAEVREQYESGYEPRVLIHTEAARALCCRLCKEKRRMFCLGVLCCSWYQVEHACVPAASVRVIQCSCNWLYSILFYSNSSFPFVSIYVSAAEYST